MNSGPGPRVFVGVDRSIPGLAALRFAVDEARRRGAPLHAVRVSEHLTMREAEEIDAAFAESMGGYPDDLVVRREILVGPVADTLTRRARYDTDVLIIGTHGGSRRHVFGPGSISRACVRKARCPVLVVPGPEMAALLAARSEHPARPGMPPSAASRPPQPARRRVGRWVLHRSMVLRYSWLGYSW